MTPLMIPYFLLAYAFVAVTVIISRKTFQPGFSRLIIVTILVLIPFVPYARIEVLTSRNSSADLQKSASKAVMRQFDMDQIPKQRYFKVLGKSGEQVTVYIVNNITGMAVDSDTCPVGTIVELQKVNAGWKNVVEPKTVWSNCGGTADGSTFPPLPGNGDFN